MYRVSKELIDYVYTDRNVLVHATCPYCKIAHDIKIIDWVYGMNDIKMPFYYPYCSKKCKFLDSFRSSK